MRRRQVERRLRSVSTQMKALRDDLQVTDEQLLRLVDEADDARLRAMVSETPLAEKEHRAAGRHAERLRAHRDGVSAKLRALEAEQDELLDQLGTL